MPDFTHGYCCSDTNGCPDDIRSEALICSKEITPFLKKVACPRDSSCGFLKKLEISDSWGRISAASSKS